MTLTIDLTPDQEARLRAEAAKRGMELPELGRRRQLSEETVMAANTEDGSGEYDPS